MATDKSITSRGGIYQIRHIGSGKVYIGSAVVICTRWYQHRTHLKAGAHRNRKLQRAWDKHGAGAFVFEVLEVVANKEELILVEQEYLDRLQPFGRQGYNLSPTAYSVLGIKHSDESRARHSAASKMRPITEEIRAKQLAAVKGKKLTDEHRAKLSAVRTGRKHPRTPAWTEKITAANRGRKHSLEHNEKISATQKGRKKTPEHQAKITAAPTGQKKGPLTSEHKAKLSAALKGRNKSLETRARMKAAWARRKQKAAPLHQLTFAFLDD